MLERRYVRENSNVIQNAILSKGFTVDLDKFLELEKKIRLLKREGEKIQTAKNIASEQIPKAASDEKADLILAMKEKGKRSDAIRQELLALEEEIATIEAEIPNIPRSDVRVGSSEKENEILREVGESTHPQFPVKNYMTIAENLDLIDMKRGAKVSGARFGYLKGELVQLEFALIHYALSVLVPQGFRPLVPPVLVRSDAMSAMGYLAAHGDDETYHLLRDDLYLVGTSEQSVGPMHQNETFLKKDLPIRYVAFSTCFRRESGSYGKDAKGILRVHQFDKLEMFSFTTEEESDNEHEMLLAMEEKLMRGLRLPYRVVKMVTGDLGVSAARKYDIETWIPSQKMYRETHSTSTCTDFQSRPLNIRYKEGENTKYVHTLNGTAFAIGRTLIAIIENYQTANGGFRVPDVLQPFVPFRVIGKE